ncbi:MAG: Xre family binding protein [Gemmatimonadetes bacterium]|nr:Xre family binding protein [Gemmatimonadota bacterium]
MKAAAFEELLTSVRQAGEIRRGRRKPSRSTTFKPADVKALRRDLGQSQVEFAPEDLWDGLAQKSEVPELSAAQRAELDRRLAEYDKNPIAGDPWETMRERLVKDRERGG